MDLHQFQWIVGPIVGAIIGLITNGIAIRMLFRPYYPVKIGKWTLPFTPGLIPKEKTRIANAIGEVVANQLVTADVLEKGMINKEIDDKIIYYFDKFLEKYKNSDLTIKDLLLKYFTEENVKYYATLTQTKVAEAVYLKAVELNLGKLSINAINKEFERKELEDPSSVQFFPMILSLIEPKIVELINNTVEKQGFFIIQDFLNTETTNLLNIKVSDIYKKNEQYLPKINESILNLYHFAVINYLPNVLKEINIAKLVEERINAFSIQELEKILLDLMRKELNAIVYLGGLLGLLMGFITNLI